MLTTPKGDPFLSQRHRGGHLALRLRIVLEGVEQRLYPTVSLSLEGTQVEGPGIRSMVHSM